MSENQNQSLTESQQNFRIAYLATCFLTLFLSYSSLQNLFSTLCEQYGYHNLGQTAILFIYFAACCSTPLTSLIIKKLGFKKTFFLCSLGYISFDLSALFMALQPNTQNHLLVKCLVCMGAYACGFSASVLWVAQGGYVSQTANQQNKSQLFALFWSIIVSNQIIGNLMGAFLLGKVNQKVYFIVLSCLAVLSSILFTFLPSVEVKKQGLQITLKSQLTKIGQIISNKRYKYLVIYFLFPGLSMAFFSGYLYKIVKPTILRTQTQSESDYHQKQNFYQGMIFIGLGVAQVLTGFFYRKYSHQFNKFKLATLGSLMVELAGVVSLICYFQKSYKLCFLAGMLWGACQIFNQTNTSVMVSILFKERVEGFAVSRIFYCIGITLFLFVNIFMSEVKISVFLTIFILLQTFATVISMNLRYLSPQNRQIEKKMIQTEDEQKQ